MIIAPGTKFLGAFSVIANLRVDLRLKLEALKVGLCKYPPHSTSQLVTTKICGGRDNNMLTFQVIAQTGNTAQT